MEYNTTHDSSQTSVSYLLISLLLFESLPSFPSSHASPVSQLLLSPICSESYTEQLNSFMNKLLRNPDYRILFTLISNEDKGSLKISALLTTKEPLIKIMLVSFHLANVKKESLT